jgi:hypothetical protein
MALGERPKRRPDRDILEVRTARGRRRSDPTDFPRVVRAFVTGLAEELAVGEFVVAAGVERLLVVELLCRETAVPVVRTPTGRALARTASSLPG